MVRRRPRPLRGDDRRSCATTACSSATATDRRRRPAAAAAAARARGSARRSTAPTSASSSARSPSSRPSSRRSGSSSSSRATCATRAQVLVVGRDASLGVTIPPLKHLGPLLVVWGAGDGDARLHPRPRLLADVLRRLPGAALRGDRTGCSFPVVGLALFVVGAWFFAHDRRPRQRPRRRLAAPVRPALYDRIGGSYQIAQSLFAQADGGLFGQGLRRSRSSRSASRATRRSCCRPRRPTSSTR